ncbi:MAG: hypothetical protein H0U67_16430 [Gemmatimonadetes bacterium]|nr:hypothetical protein [Gemmatimonadota bacterium]
MSDSRTHAGRLRKLEAVYTAPATCAACHGYPARIVYADPETEIPWHESIPPTGCPDCGTPPRGRELWVMIPQTDDGEPPI